MDSTDWEKDIDKDNYLEFFPQLKWINFTVTREQEKILVITNIMMAE